MDGYVVKINTAMSNKPFFVKITNPDMSVDRIFAEAISTLKNIGRPLESQQLENLYEKHQIYNDGALKTKGSLFSELKMEEQTVGSSEVQIASLDLISSHAGGEC